MAVDSSAPQATKLRAMLEGKACLPYNEPMTTLTITAKGQVTLKKELLEHLGVGPGQKIDVDALPDGSLKVRAAPKGKISDVFGFLDNNGVHLTIEEINEVIARGWAGEREDNS